VKIATWNVNGIRARQAQLDAWAAAEKPDVICLQEIKASPQQLPGLLSDLDGYWCYWHGDKGYSGVAILVAQHLAVDRPTFVHPPFDFESRIVTVRLADMVIASVYVPNGGKDYPAKLEFLGALDAFAVGVADTGTPLVICGDLNVARHERDVHPKERNHQPRPGRHRPRGCPRR
jgi:exodeoxyribonuclease-3